MAGKKAFNGNQNSSCSGSNKKRLKKTLNALKDYSFIVQNQLKH